MLGFCPPSETFGTATKAFLGGLNPCSQTEGTVLLNFHLFILSEGLFSFCVVDVVVIIICFVCVCFFLGGVL